MKYQWHNVKWGMDFDSLKTAILNEPYSEDIGHGFRLGKSTTSSLLGTYIVKKTYTEEVITPVGNQELLDRIQYVMYEFEVCYGQQLALTLKNPPRSISEIGSAFSRVTNHQATFIPMKVNLRDAITLLENELENLLIGKMQISNIPFSNNSLGTVTLRSTGDLASLVNDHIDISKGKVTKIDFSFTQNHERKKASISTQGTLVCDDDTSIILKPVTLKILSNLIS